MNPEVGSSAVILRQWIIISTRWAIRHYPRDLIELVRQISYNFLHKMALAAVLVFERMDCAWTAHGLHTDSEGWID